MGKLSVNPTNVSSPQERMSSISVFSTVLNVMLGSGPILVPPVFQQAGLGLTSFFVVGISFMSYICAEFIIETMSLLSAMRAKRQTYSQIQDEKSINASKQYKIISGSYISRLSEDSPTNTPLKTEFEYEDNMEYGLMAQEMFGNIGQGSVTMILVIYTIGMLASKTIIIGSILSTVFSGIYLLDQRQSWIISFFSISVLFSLKNVTNTKILQKIMILVRFSTISVLLVGSIQVASTNGLHNLNELGSYFQFDNFASFSSVFQLALLMHHSIPAMFGNIDRQKNVKKVMFFAFGLGTTSLVLLSLAGIIAFGKCLNSQEVPTCHSPYLNPSNYFNNYFKGIEYTGWVFYISSFYFFFDISSFPVAIITARTNFMRFLMPDKSANTITVWTLLSTALITLPILTIALLTTNIQLVIDWISGIFGLLIICILPCIFVYFTRKRAANMGIEYLQNFHQAIFPQKYLPFYVMSAGTLLMFYTVYKNIENLIQ